MAIELKKLSVRNFKSVKELELENPPNLLVLVGKNDSGKSNFFDIFNFLSEGAKNYPETMKKRGGIKEITWKKGRTGSENLLIRIEFAMSDDARISYVEQLFKENVNYKAEKVLETGFLRRVAYSLVYTGNDHKEELSVSGFDQRNPWVTVVRIIGDNHSCKRSMLKLQEICKALKPDESINFVDENLSGQSNYLCLGNILNSAPRSIEQNIAAMIHEKLSGIKWLGPVRFNIERMEMRTHKELDDKASNLVGVLHTIQARYPESYREIQYESQKLVETLGTFISDPEGNTTTFAIQDLDSTGDLFYSIGQLSAGTRNAISIVTAVVCSTPGSWIFIEEPEAHLHPEAQAVLFNFLSRQAETKQIYITTHSQVVASNTPLTSLRLVDRDREGSHLTTVNESNVDQVIKELGIRPSYNFEANGVVFIDGDDEPIYDEWARKCDLRNVQFISTGGWENMRYFASAKILKCLKVKPEVFGIFEGDTERGTKNKKAKERLKTELQLPEQNLWTMGMSEVEGYLLDARAICRAFPTLSSCEHVLRERLEKYRNKRDQKRVLVEIFRDYKLGDYDSKRGAEIIRFMDEVPEEVKNFFEIIRKEINA